MIQQSDNFKSKRVLVMGLGLLGGGVATAQWFVKHGAKVTVTDIKSRQELKNSIRKLGRAAKQIKFVLGRHRMTDFKNHDVIVVNPAVPRKSPYLAAARRAGRMLVNDARIFFDLVPNPIVAVTGTRGKTTTTNWIAHFLRAEHQGAVAAGNTPEMPFLALIDRLRNRKTPVVAELSSWQLELLEGSRRAPEVAVITNIYRDHLNRYRSMHDYARAKASIFLGQNFTQHLVLNYDNHWTTFFMRLKPKSKTYFFSLRSLPQSLSGIYIQNGAVRFQDERISCRVLSARELSRFSARGTHNVQNLLASMLTSHLAGMPWEKIAEMISTLPEIRFREEVVLRKDGLVMVNDATATSPEAIIAAVERFKSANLFLIAGGTDKKLDFTKWARFIERHLNPDHLFLLEGSATRKMVQALSRIGYFKKERPQCFRDLQVLLRTVRERLESHSRATVLFSPGAASFEMFRNEFDRGERFNRLIRRLFSSS